MKALMKKLVLAVMLVGVIAGCLAGCTNDKPDGGDNQDNKSEHSLSAKIFAEDATCTEDGYKAYYYCFDCDAVFDENKNEVKKEDLVIPALGHDFGDDYVCKNCKLDVSEVVEAINTLPAPDAITLTALGKISEIVSKYDALDEAAKTIVASLVDDPEKLTSLSEQVSGIEVGVKAKYLYDAGQNQNLTNVRWTEDVDPVYGNYKMIEYDRWQWANLAYSSSTLPTGKKVVLFVYNASDRDVELTWGAVDPAKNDCIYHGGVGWANGAEDPEVGHQVMTAKSWNTVIIDWTAIYGFSAKLFVTGHYAGDGTNINGWKFSDVYMMDADQLETMTQIINNSVAG